MYSKILYNPHSAWASGLRVEGKCHRGSESLLSSVEDFRIENISSSMCHGGWLFVEAVGLDNNIVYVVTHRGIDKRGIVAPCVLLVSKHFYPCEIDQGGLLSYLPELGSLLLTPCVSLVVVEIPVG